MEKDFFISRAGSDIAIAIVIADIVRRAGFTTLLQDEDFGHASFMARMAEGYASGARMIALLSSDYQQSDYCKSEYENILSDDPQNKHERLIVLRITAVSPIEHLKALAFTDLVPVLNNAAALEHTVRVAIGVDSPPLDFSMHRPAGQIIHPEVSTVLGFTGRDTELKAIETALFGLLDNNTATPTDNGSERITLQGLGGVGKSLLAKQYAWLNRDRFAGVWWVRAENTAILDEDLIALGSRFIVGIETEPNRERAVQTVLAELIRQNATDANKPWLLIYDNVEQPNDLIRRLPQQGVKVLITSHWTDWYPDAIELPVDTFASEVAIEYLLARARNETASSAADLANELGYLPLALDHARTYCWQSRCSFANYQSRLDVLMDKAPVNASYPASVYATFRLAIERAVDQYPQADAIIGTLSLLSADAIPIFLIAELCNNNDELDATLSALTTVSLLTDAPLEDGTPAVNQHRLVQAVARHRLAENTDTAVKRAFYALNSLWPKGEGISQPSNWPLCTRLLAHATCLLERIEAPSPADESIALLAASVGYYTGVRGDLSTGYKWYCKSLVIRQRALGEMHPDTASSYNGVGYILVAQGCYMEAEPLIRKGLEIYQRMFGEEHPSTLTSYNNVAMNLNAQGCYAEAEPLLRKVLETSARILGEEHQDTAGSYHNLAINVSAQGRYTEAESLLLKGLEINQRVFGEEHPNTVQSYNGVAANLGDQGRYTEAELLFHKGLEIRQNLFGDEHPDTAASYDLVATNLDDQGRYTEAEPLLCKGLEIRQRVLGEEHPATATSYNNVATNLNAQGRYIESEPLLCKVLEIRKRVLGNMHPDTASSYQSVATNLYSQGRHAEAESFIRESLIIRQHKLGGEHPFTATSYNDMGLNLAAQGRHVEAEPLLSQGLEIRQRVLGEEHPATAASYNNVANNLNDQGRHIEAEPLFRRGLSICQRVLGEEHPRTAVGYNNLANNLYTQGHYAEAERLYRRGLEISERMLGTSHPTTEGIRSCVKKFFDSNI